MAMFGNIFGGNKPADGSQPLPAPSSVPQPITFTPFPTASAPVAPPSPLPPPAPVAPAPFVVPEPVPTFAPLAEVPQPTPQPLPELRLATPPQAVAVHTPLATSAPLQAPAVAMPPTFEPLTVSPIPEPTALPLPTQAPVEAAQQQIGAALEKNVAEERSLVEKELLDITARKEVLARQHEQVVSIRTSLELLEASITSQHADVIKLEEMVSAREQSIEQAASVLR